MIKILSILPLMKGEDNCFQIAVSGYGAQSTLKSSASLSFVTRNKSAKVMSEIDSKLRLPSEVCDKLNKALSGKTVYCERFGDTRGHLDQLFSASGREQEFKVRPMESLIPEVALNVWLECKEQVMGLFKMDADRADSHASVCCSILERIDQGDSLPNYAQALQSWCERLVQLDGEKQVQTKVA